MRGSPAFQALGCSKCCPTLPDCYNDSCNKAQCTFGLQKSRNSRHRPCWPGSHSAARIAHLLGVQGHLQIIPCVSEAAIAALAQRSFRFLRCVAPPCWRHATLLRKLHNSAGVSRTLQTVKYPRLSAPPPLLSAEDRARARSLCAAGAGGHGHRRHPRVSAVPAGLAVVPEVQPLRVDPSQGPLDRRRQLHGDLP